MGRTDLRRSTVYLCDNENTIIFEDEELFLHLKMNIRTSFFLLYASSFATLSLSSSPLPPDERYLMFQKFIEDFEKEYATKEEHEYRFGIFLQNLEEIERQNNDNNGNGSFKLGITPFADLLPHELPLGHDKTRRYVQSKRQGNLRTSGASGDSTRPKLPFQLFDEADIDLSTLPKEVDWRKNDPDHPLVTTPVSHHHAARNDSFTYNVLLSSLSYFRLFPLVRLELRSKTNDRVVAAGPSQLQPRWKVT